MIENEELHAAITQLSKEEIIFLTLRFKFGLSQLEIAGLMEITQQAASKRERNILKKIKKLMKYGCEKR